MQPKVTPKDFFLWVGAMAFLYGSVTSLIALLFQYINHAFPDPLSYVDPYSGGMRFAMASLIVLMPATLILMRIIRKDIMREAVKSELWVRRWALFLTVFIAGVTVVIDLITLVNYFLGGDLTTRFILKVVVVLLVVGGAFLHFLADIRGYWIRFPERARYVGWGVGVLVLVSIIAGFFIMGSPSQVRLYRFDEQKVSDLQNIQWQIVNYWQQKQAFPKSLADLEDPISGYVVPKDPQTGDDYGFALGEGLAFSLCATFNAESRAGGGESMPVRAYGSLDGNWEHGVGKVCFERVVDPERYPPFDKDSVKPMAAPPAR
jgi:hypothetical protein